MAPRTIKISEFSSGCNLSLNKNPGKCNFRNEYSEFQNHFDYVKLLMTNSNKLLMRLLLTITWYIGTETIF